MYFALQPGDAPHGSWTADILFVVISTSGSSVVSVVNRLFRGRLKDASVGRAELVLVAITIVLLSLASILYGATAAGYARSYAVLEATVLLIASLVMAVSAELSLADKLV